MECEMEEREREFLLCADSMDVGTWNHALKRNLGSKRRAKRTTFQYPRVCHMEEVVVCGSSKGQGRRAVTEQTQLSAEVPPPSGSSHGGCMTRGQGSPGTMSVVSSSAGAPAAMLTGPWGMGCQAQHWRETSLLLEPSPCWTPRTRDLGGIWGNIALLSTPTLKMSYTWVTQTWSAPPGTDSSLTNCYGLNCVPSKCVCWSPNTQFLRIWPVCGERIISEAIRLKWDHQCGP